MYIYHTGAFIHYNIFKCKNVYSVRKHMRIITGMTEGVRFNLHIKINLRARSSVEMLAALVYFVYLFENKARLVCTTPETAIFRFSVNINE